MLNLNITFDYFNSNDKQQRSPFTMRFNLSLKKGETVAIVGASGAGKSTLLNLIAGFILPNAGEIWLNGENCTFRSPADRPVSMLFQQHNLFGHLTVAQNLALGLKPNLHLTSVEKAQVKTAAQAVGLADYLDRLPSSLSGGQQQRVAIARCLLRDRPILLLDEPFSALDPELRREMCDLILDLCQRKKLTLLMVTHQVDEVANKVGRIFEVKNGELLAVS